MQPNDTARIPLRTRDGVIRAYAIVDAADAEHVNRQRWHLAEGYAAHSIARRPQTPLIVRMHRYLLGLTHGDGIQVDHINRDKLDNRRANLRIVTMVGNAQNKGSFPGSSSIYRGVTWDKPAQKWRAQINVSGRVINLGRFHDEAEAGAAARDAREKHLPFAVD